MNNTETYQAELTRLSQDGTEPVKLRAAAAAGAEALGRMIGKDGAPYNGRCLKCGELIAISARYCSKCGQRAPKWRGWEWDD